MCKELKPATLSGLLGGEARRRVGLSSFTLSHFVVTSLIVLFLAGCGTKTTDTTSAPTAPSAPTGLSAAPGNGQVMISWSSVSGATSYNIYWSTTTGVTKTNGTKITGATSPYTHTPLTNSTTYYYIVTAVNSAGESVESAQVSAKPEVNIYAGTYSGTLTVNSVSSGTFSVTVDNAGGMSGSMNVNNSITAISGQVTTNGNVTFTLSGKSDQFSGTINASTGVFAASCSGCTDSVVFTGTKQTTGVGTKFPIATTAAYEMAVGGAFDGTNYLIAIGTDQAPAGGGSSSDVQFISQSGIKVGSLIQGGGNGGLGGVAYDGSNYLLLGEDCTSGCYIWGRFVNPSGAMGSIFTILPANTYGGYGTPIAYGGGSYLVIYSRAVSSSTSDGSKVYGRLISPSGTVGSEITISSAAGGFLADNPMSNNVFFDGNNFLVVWDTNTTIMGRFVSPSGTMGTEFTIRTRLSSGCTQHNPVGIAFDGTNYFVAWHESEGACTTTGVTGLWNLLGQLVTTSGTASGNVISVSTATGTQFDPSIAFDGTKYLVIWTDMRNDTDNDWVCDSNEGTCMDIYGQYISKTGALMGSEFVINNDAGNQFGGGVGFNNGKHLVVINDGFTIIPGTTTTYGFSNNDVYGVFVTP